MGRWHKARQRFVSTEGIATRLQCWCPRVAGQGRRRMHTCRYYLSSSRLAWSPSPVRQQHTQHSHRQLKGKHTSGKHVVARHLQEPPVGLIRQSIR